MPRDLRDKFNTALSPQEEAQFQAWAKKTGRESDTYDYDLRGAWKADAKAATNGHLPDTWKKPNHPTFSVESQYSGPASGLIGGQWVDKGKGRWAFKASEYNAQNMTPEELRKYFAEREPDSELVLPNLYDARLRRLYPNEAK